MDLQSLQGHARERGLGRYSLAIAQAIAAQPAVTQFEVLLNSGTSAQFMARARKDLATQLPEARVHLFDAPWPWERGNPLDVVQHQRAQRLREARIRELDPDVLIVGSLFELPITSVVSVPPRSQGSWAVTPFTAVIGYDLLPFTDPECAFPASWQPFLDMRLASLADADLILAISDYTASEFRRVLGPTCPPVATIWGAAGDLGDGDQQLALPLSQRRGVLCAGGGGGTRKNERATVAAFAALPSRLRDLHPLTIQGGREAAETQGLQALATDLGLSPGQYVIRDERVSEAELHQLYAAARVVTMPSLAEGLGLPVLEAWSAGTPAIASATTSLGELVGDDRWTFAPRDAGHQARLLETLLTDDGQWEQARDYARVRGNQFTWRASAELAVAAIMDARGSATAGPAPVTMPPLRLVAPAGVPKLACEEGNTSLAELLADHYDVQVSSACDPGWEGRSVAVLSDSASSARLLAAPELTAAVLFAESAQLTNAVPEPEPRPGSRGVRALAYAERGAAALASAVAVGPELMRVGLGVIPADAGVWRALAAQPGGLPPQVLMAPALPGPRDQVGAALADFIEGSYRRRHLDAIEVAVLQEDMLLERLGRNRPDRLAGTVYCDVTGPVRAAHHTSAQVAALALHRSLLPLVAGRVMPVALRGGVLLHETSLLTAAFAVPAAEFLEFGPYAVRRLPGEILLVSQAHEEVDAWALALDRWASGGGHYVQFLPDLTAVQMPGFLPDAGRATAKWLALVGERADLVICATVATATAVGDWFAAHPAQRPDGRSAPEIRVIPMGFDLDQVASYPTSIRSRTRGQRRVLVVGDLEAQSGIEAILDAAEALWRQGRETAFMIVADAGEHADPQLCARLAAMTRSPKPLEWVTGATEVDIRWQYLEADLLVAPARDDDLGLRALGALAHGLPVLARDIPAHREILGPDGDFFALDGDLAAAISNRLASEAPIRYEPARLVTWEQSGRELVSALVEIGLAPPSWQVGSGDQGSRDDSGGL